MKFIGKNLIFAWAGILPAILGGFNLSNWQTWLTIISIALLVELHKVCS